MLPGSIIPGVTGTFFGNDWVYYPEFDPNYGAPDLLGRQFSSSNWPVEGFERLDPLREGIGKTEADKILERIRPKSVIPAFGITGDVTVEPIRDKSEARRLIEIGEITDPTDPRLSLWGTLRRELERKAAEEAKRREEKSRVEPTQITPAKGFFGVTGDLTGAGDVARLYDPSIVEAMPEEQAAKVRQRMAQLSAEIGSSGLRRTPGSWIYEQGYMGPVWGGLMGPATITGGY